MPTVVKRWDLFGCTGLVLDRYRDVTAQRGHAYNDVKCRIMLSIYDDNSATFELIHVFGQCDVINDFIAHSRLSVMQSVLLVHKLVDYAFGDRR